MSGALSPIGMGPIAAAIVQHDGEAEVVAVFERCFYVRCPGGIVCVGIETLGDGPLNVLLSAPNAAIPGWASQGITREAKGRVAEGRLYIGDRFALDVLTAPIWQPPAWPTTTGAEIAHSLVTLRALAAPLCPAEGLSRLVLGSAERADRTARAAAPTVQQLAAALAQSVADDRPSAELTRSAVLLLGLGPGLTPSGDDLLGGMFLALSALGRTGLRDKLWTAIEPELDLLTVDISAAHLSAAADGLGAGIVHATLAAILTADVATFHGHLANLGGLGHSSGFDTLAGIVLTLDTVGA